MTTRTASPTTPANPDLHGHWYTVELRGYDLTVTISQGHEAHRLHFTVVDQEGNPVTATRTRTLITFPLPPERCYLYYKRLLISEVAPRSMVRHCKVNYHLKLYIMFSLL